MDEEPRTWRVTYHARGRFAYPEEMIRPLLLEEHIIAEVLTRQEAVALARLICPEGVRAITDAK